MAWYLVMDREQALSFTLLFYPMNKLPPFVFIFYSSVFSRLGLYSVTVFPSSCQSWPRLVCVCVCDVVIWCVSAGVGSRVEILISGINLIWCRSLLQASSAVVWPDGVELGAALHSVCLTWYCAHFLPLRDSLNSRYWLPASYGDEGHKEHRDEIMYRKSLFITTVTNSCGVLWRWSKIMQLLPVLVCTLKKRAVMPLNLYFWESC
jgi:hypothetical protein